MEGIVVGIAELNFHQNSIEVTNVNSVAQLVNNSTSTMSTPETSFNNTENEAANDSVQETQNPFSESSTFNNSVWEENVDDGLGNERQNRKGCTLSERRQMPRRSSKSESLSGVKHRTQMKPAKRVKHHEDFKNLKPSQIRKIYLNKKLTNFRPSSLETIFEEASTSHNTEDNLSDLIGGRKIKRSLSLPDGTKRNRNLLNRRRAKIKKTFGKRFALKKISFEEFITKLNNSIEKTESDSGSECCMDDKRSPNKTDILCSMSSPSCSLNNTMSPK